MNSVAGSPFASNKFLSGTNLLPEEEYSANLVQKQAVKTSESLTAGLTIKTREGDMVTINSNSFSKAESFLYNQQGILQSEDGFIRTSINYKEVTLKSGESFTFSVKGDLNEQEIEDIAQIIKDIDEIISEMAQGDMKDAVSKALLMGGYESVAAYSADLTYSRSYEMASYQSASQSYEATPAMVEDRPGVSRKAIGQKGRDRHGKAHKIYNADDFMEKMAKKLEKRESKLLENAVKPIDKIFEHHLNELKKEDILPSTAYKSLNEARKNLEEMINQMVSSAFQENVEDFF